MFQSIRYELVFGVAVPAHWNTLLWFLWCLQTPGMTTERKRSLRMTMLLRLSQVNDKVCDGITFWSSGCSARERRDCAEQCRQWQLTVQSSADSDSWLCRAVMTHWQWQQTAQNNANSDSRLRRTILTVTADCPEQCWQWQLTVQSSADSDSWLQSSADCPEQCWQWQLTVLAVTADCTEQWQLTFKKMLTVTADCSEQCWQWQLTAEQYWQWQLTVRAVMTMTADCAEQRWQWQLTAQSSADNDSWLCRAVLTMTADCRAVMTMAVGQASNTDIVQIALKCMANTSPHPPTPPPPSTFVSKRQS